MAEFMTQNESKRIYRTSTYASDATINNHLIGFPTTSKGLRPIFVPVREKL
jgi:hypothetical protein